MKSNTLTRCYGRWQAGATAQQIAFVDSVFELAERNYDAGGDTIVECWEPDEILDRFRNLDDVRTFCGMNIDRELDARWGEDSDPEIGRAERFKSWEM
jgi:hypothetical protein